MLIVPAVNFVITHLSIKQIHRSLMSLIQRDLTVSQYIISLSVGEGLEYTGYILLGGVRLPPPKMDVLGRIWRTIIIIKLETLAFNIDKGIKQSVFSQAMDK